MTHRDVIKKIAHIICEDESCKVDCDKLDCDSKKKARIICFEVYASLTRECYDLSIKNNKLIVANDKLTKDNQKLIQENLKLLQGGKNV